MPKELKADRLRKKIEELQKELSDHQSRCKHKRVVGVYGASTGNYDPSSNAYWIDIRCEICGDQWRVYDEDPNFNEICRKTPTIKL